MQHATQTSRVSALVFYPSRTKLLYAVRACHVRHNLTPQIDPVDPLFKCKAGPMCRLRSPHATGGLVTRGMHAPRRSSHRCSTLMALQLDPKPLNAPGERKLSRTILVYIALQVRYFISIDREDPIHQACSGKSTPSLRQRRRVKASRRDAHWQHRMSSTHAGSTAYRGT